VCRMCEAPLAAHARARSVQHRVGPRARHTGPARTPSIPFAILVGIVGTATVSGGFVGSLPSFVAVLLNNVTRGDAHSAWGHSHCQWQSRTCWFAVLRARRGAVVGVPILIALTL
jgi:hypothetical protein